MYLLIANILLILIPNCAESLFKKVQLDRWTLDCKKEFDPLFVIQE
jgi:hypothetical protein